MKIHRAIGILSLLLQKKKVTAAELAEKFEVSQRTIYRDIKDINEAGIPITASSGRNGGISIMKGFAFDRTALFTSEVKAIISGLQSLDSVSGTKYYQQLMDKISAAPPNTVKADSGILIDLSGWDKSAVSSKIELIKSAMDKRRMIKFRYHSPSGESVRRLEPYHLIYQWSGWYVWGFCAMRENYRMFKLTRITELETDDETFVPREIPEYKCEKLRHASGGEKATVKFDKSVKWRIIDEFGIDNWTYDKKGNILMDFEWEDKEAFYRYILTFGDSAEILSPQSFRGELYHLARNILEKYRVK